MQCTGWRCHEAEFYACIHTDRALREALQHSAWVHEVLVQPLATSMRTSLCMHNIRA